jgi:hypothetical protein
MRFTAVCKKWLNRSFLLLAIAALTPACGGGGGGTPAAAPTSLISGKAVDGPIQNATVQVYAVTAAGALGSLLGSGTTNATGDFSITIPPQSGPIGVKVSGGAGAQYKDEATGTAVPFAVTDILLAYCPSGGTATVNVNVTPLTHMAALRVQQIAATAGLPLATLITDVNGFVAQQFNLTDILGVTPADLTNGSAQTAGTQPTSYGLALAGLSQEALASSVSTTALVNAMALDFQSDGIFDGSQNGTPISLGAGSLSATDATGALSTGMTNFLNGAHNTSTLTPAAETAYITPISGGSIPPAPSGFAGTAGNATATLTWHAVPGATSYAIYLAQSSSGGEFHPPALTEPDGSLSTHPALTVQHPA